MKFIISIPVILILLFFFVRFLEQISLYHPYKSIEATPQDIALDYEDVNIATADGVKLNGWFIPSDMPRATILFSHGNGGNISHRLEKIKILNKLDLNILIYDYRGYGLSAGKPSEEGLYLDADAMYRYLINKKKISPETIIAYGESLGGAVAINLASKQVMGGLIIEDSFTSVSEVAKKIFPFIPAAVYKSKYDSLTIIKNIDVPKLMFHSIEDEIIPFELGKKLFDASAEPKKFVELRGGHNDAFMVSQELFIEEIGLFIDKLLK